MTGLRRSSVEFTQHGFQPHVSRFEQNEKVIEEIGRFCTELFVALADPGDNRLDGFLAKLLGTSGGAFIQERLRVGGGGGRGAARG